MIYPPPPKLPGKICSSNCQGWFTTPQIIQFWAKFQMHTTSCFASQRSFLQKTNHSYLYCSINYHQQPLSRDKNAFQWDVYCLLVDHIPACTVAGGVPAWRGTCPGGCTCWGEYMLGGTWPGGCLPGGCHVTYPIMHLMLPVCWLRTYWVSAPVQLLIVWPRCLLGYTPPPPQTEWQTGAKILPCPKLHLQSVKIGRFHSISMIQWNTRPLPPPFSLLLGWLSLFLN